MKRISAAMAMASAAMISVVGAASAASAEGVAPIVARAEACLRSNVDRVVAADPGLDSAASFLVGYVCAAEVAGATRYEMNVTIVESFGAIGASFAKPDEAGKTPAPAPIPAATVDPETGDIVLAKPGAGANPMSLLGPIMGRIGGLGGQLGAQAAPASLRKLAGALVLEARERQLAKAR